MVQPGQVRSSGVPVPQAAPARAAWVGSSAFGQHTGNERRDRTATAVRIFPHPQAAFVGVFGTLKSDSFGSVLGRGAFQ